MRAFLTGGLVGLAAVAMTAAHAELCVIPARVERARAAEREGHRAEADHLRGRVAELERQAAWLADVQRQLVRHATVAPEREPTPTIPAVWPPLPEGGAP